MNALYVFQANGQPTGPFTPEALARAIADGAVPRDVFVAPAGAAQWLHASQMPEVSAFVDAMIRARSNPPPPMFPQAQQLAPPSSVQPQAPAVQPQASAVQPQAPAAQAFSQPAVATTPQAKPADAKPAEEKPKAKPWPKWLPAAIFGGFAVIALVEVAVALVVAPKSETTEEQPPDLTK
jgi:uncharacterized protein DUF4339